VASILVNVFFCLSIFFLFLVGPYSVEIASPGGGKSLAGRRLANRSLVIFAEFCPRGWDSIRQA
jgi:hypothetical protein